MKTVKTEGVFFSLVSWSEKYRCCYLLNSTTKLCFSDNMVHYDRLRLEVVVSRFAALSVRARHQGGCETFHRRWSLWGPRYTDRATWRIHPLVHSLFSDPKSHLTSDQEPSDPANPPPHVESHNSHLRRAGGDWSPASWLWPWVLVVPGPSCTGASAPAPASPPCCPTPAVGSRDLLCDWHLCNQYSVHWAIAS